MTYNVEVVGGDVFFDGSLRAENAQMILKEYLGVLGGNKTKFTADQDIACDLDDSGKVDADDAQIALMQYIRSLAGVPFDIITKEL